jgi:5-methyltetrahydrofolate--homocysteine methyltransferase
MISKNIGAEAKSIFNNANDLLETIIKQKTLKANAVFGFYKCNSNDQDDILIYDENDKHIHTLHGLRQQVDFIVSSILYSFLKLNCDFEAAKDPAEKDSSYLCLSDFIAPASSNKTDYIGMFAVSILGAEDLCKSFLEKLDDFK